MATRSSTRRMKHRRAQRGGIGIPDGELPNTIPPKSEVLQEGTKQEQCDAFWGVNQPNYGSKPNELRFLWFQPEAVPKNFAAVIYGQRRSGKTCWLLWFMWCMQHDFDRVVCYSSTNFKGEFQKVMNPKLCFPHYDEASLNAVLEEQAATPADKRERVLIILDDVLDQENIFRKKGTQNALVRAYTMGRHYGISVIMCTQYARSIPTAWRRNVDFAVIFYTFSADMAEIYYKEYGALLSRSQFMSILSQATHDHTALVVRPCTKSREMIDYYQLSQAIPPEKCPKFTIGRMPEDEKEEAPPPQPPPGPTFF